MRRTQIALNLTATILAAVLLSGCETWHSTVNYIRSDSASVCPDAAILANTSVIPVFDPKQGADPSNVVYTVRMADLKSRCDYSKHNNTIDANVRIFFDVSRAPGGEEAHYKVPYYIAVTSNGEIIDKQIHWFEFDFPKAAANARLEELVNSIMIPVARDKKSFEYHLLLGFQLTKTQVDYNKKMGQYLP